MEVYFEQSVANPNIDKHRKRTQVLTVLRYVCIGVAVVIAMFGWLMPIGNVEGTNPLLAILWVLLLIVLGMAPFILAFFFLGRIIANGNLEFDYVLSGNLFRVVKVVNRKKRKKLLETQVSGFESLGHINSEAYDRYASTKEIKKLFAVGNYDDEDLLYYIYYVSDGNKYLLHFAPNNDMIMALRKSVTRITVLDKSFKTHEVKDESVLG